MSNQEIDRPILKAFEEVAVPNLPTDAPDNTDVPLLVTFKLGDLRSLKRRREHLDNVTRKAFTGAA